ncbi:hypothetical protein ACPESU_38530 [Nocardia iowensis]|uniref:hypothetical protein n=1 Tax=Nocardia iowensis TaxID=204891 RepID=UPI003C2B4C2F
MGAYKAAKRGVAAERRERRDERREGAAEYLLPPLGSCVSATPARTGQTGPSRSRG